jgi:hypothetical protein
MALRIKFVLPDAGVGYRSGEFSDDNAKDLEALIRTAVDSEQNNTYFNMTLEDGETKMFVPAEVLKKGILFLEHKED